MDGFTHLDDTGAARMVDVSDERAPRVEAEYREPENDPDSCSEFNPPRTSYSAHNPTLTPHIAFSTWHSSGLEAISVADPERPYQIAEFTPEPLDSVLLEDGRYFCAERAGERVGVGGWSPDGMEVDLAVDPLEGRERPIRRAVVD